MYHCNQNIDSFYVEESKYNELCEQRRQSFHSFVDGVCEITKTISNDERPEKLVKWLGKKAYDLTIYRKL